MRARTVHIVLILAAVVVSALWFRVPGVERAVFRDWSDDAFFYVIVADSIVEGRGSTSDGIGLTNGYHPLWVGAHLALRWAFEDPLRPLALAQFAILAVALLLLYRFLSVRAGPTVALLAALTACFETTFRQVLGAGMETGLAFAALLAVLILLPPGDLGDLSGRRRVALQAALAMLFFARLDGGLLWIALAIVVLLRTPARGQGLATRARELLRLFLPPAIPAMAYLGFNQAVFGTAMPISGRVKALTWPRLAEVGPARYLGRAFDKLAVPWGPQTFELPWGISAYFPRRSLLHAAGWALWLVLVALALRIMARSLGGGLPQGARRALPVPGDAQGRGADLLHERHPRRGARRPGGGGALRRPCAGPPGLRGVHPRAGRPILKMRRRRSAPAPGTPCRA